LNKFVATGIAALSVSFSVPAFAGAEKVSPDQIAFPAPPAGQGQVVFYRPGGMSGSAVACSIHENGEKVSSLGGGRYFIMNAAPGKHEFSVKTEATDQLTLELEPDERQFVACRIKMGIMVGRPDIRPSSEEEFRSGKKFGLVDDEDMGPGPGAMRAADVEAALAGGSAAAPDAAEEEAAPSSNEEPAPAEGAGEGSAE